MFICCAAICFRTHCKSNSCMLLTLSPSFPLPPTLPLLPSPSYPPPPTPLLPPPTLPPLPSPSYPPPPTPLPPPSYPPTPTLPLLPSPSYPPSPFHLLPSHPYPPPPTLPLLPSTSYPQSPSRQWVALQKLRTKIKKQVDTRASKARKIRCGCVSVCGCALTEINVYIISLHKIVCVFCCSCADTTSIPNWWGSWLPERREREGSRTDQSMY